jgi:hypothetical protein
MKYKKGRLNVWRITHLPVHERLNYATAPPATLKKRVQVKICNYSDKIKISELSG